MEYKKPFIKHRPAITYSTLREWHSSYQIKKSNLIYPIFIAWEECDIKGFPEQKRISPENVVAFLKPLVEKGLSSVLLFAYIVESQKDEDGQCAFSEEKNPVLKALQNLEQEFGDKLMKCADLCLCDYTSTGQCGVVEKINELSYVKNEQTIQILGQLAVQYAKYGANVICPSDMMDNRVLQIRKELDINNFQHIPIMSYASKFASCMYGPFRFALESAPKTGDRKTYQLPVQSSKLAVKTALRDQEEGASFIIVKPGITSLDIVYQVSQSVQLPVFAYQVSGEFAMIYYAAQNNAFQLKDAVIESMYCFLRAGCTGVITYFTPFLLDWLP